MSDTGTERHIEWLPSRPGDGARIGRNGAKVVVEWPGIGRLLSSPSGVDAEFSAVAGADAAILEKFQATGLLACHRYLTGSMSLHGSAVGLPAGAVALVGDSGAGKSTTAMALVEQHRGTFLADDVVPIDWPGSVPVVSPVEDSFWLAGDASAWFGLEVPVREKRPCPPRARATAPERLRAIVHLAFDETLDVMDLQPLTGQEAFAVLSSVHICFSTGGDEDALRNLKVRARLAAAVRIFRLRRPRALDALGDISELLAKHVSALGSAQDPA